MNNRKVIITGSEGLIGTAVADYFENSNADVVRLDIKLGHNLTDELFVKQTMQVNADAHILVNLFALNPQPGDQSTDLYDISLASLEEYMKVNLVALFSVCREFARCAQNGTSIINFSSIYGIRSPKHHIYPDNFTKHIGYTITKAGVIGMTKYLATYLAPRIRVNAVVPGGVENNQDKAFQKNYSENSPMKRLMRKEEIISAVEYFSSKRSTYTTGSVLKVDGGWTAW